MSERSPLEKAEYAVVSCREDAERACRFLKEINHARLACSGVGATGPTVVEVLDRARPIAFREVADAVQAWMEAVADRDAVVHETKGTT